MPKINVLPKYVAELIAAGEVVERPSSVIKELVENSVDAGATAITVEIQHGGILYMRVTDNGCGIEKDDIATAFIRHATSKLHTEDDLNNIATLGFRGEALAAISSVSRVEMLTCTDNSVGGTRFTVDGGVNGIIEEVGCPKGTTVIVRDIFYNTPARMKFLKSDSAESAAIGQIVDRIALSHPEISFKFIRDGKLVLSTSGDKKLPSAIYAVLGKDYFGGLIPASNDYDGVRVTGYTCKPVFCKPNRNGQFFFLNGRLVKSGTAVAAVEQAYKNSSMIGKFPYCVLNIELPFNMVDVNVHPAKTEVRFSDEKKVFNCIYYAVKTAIINGDTRPEMKLSQNAVNNRFERMSAEKFRQMVLDEQKHPYENGKVKATESPNKPENKTETAGFYNAFNQSKDNDIFKGKKTEISTKLTLNDIVENDGEVITHGKYRISPPDISVDETENTKSFDANKEAQTVNNDNGISQEITAETDNDTEKINNNNQTFSDNTDDSDEAVKYIGEAFATYILVQKGESIFIVDKHAAHERIIFERLKKTQKIESQMLVAPLSFTLDKGEYEAVTSNIDAYEKLGFEIEDFGNNSVIVSAVPSVIPFDSTQSLVSEIAESLKNTGIASAEIFDDLYHIVACKSAVKGGNFSYGEDLARLAKAVLSSNDIMYCPHGRPVAMEIKRREIEKQFGRIQ